MTTSPLPWTTSPASNGGSFIKDASGRTIALFMDYRDAELVLEAPATKAEFQALQEQVEDLTEQLRELANR